MPRFDDAGTGPLVARLFFGAFWVPAAVLLAHGLFSLAFDLYYSFPFLDLPMHLAGGLAFAFACSRSLEILARARQLTPGCRSFQNTLVFSLTATAAVFWEFAEYVSDHTFGTHAQLGLEDTLLDMLIGAAAGAIFVLVTNLFAGRRR